MIKFWWTLRLACLMVRYGISDLRGAWPYANDEAWQNYREQGFSPMGAIEEDWSYGFPG